MEKPWGHLKYIGLALAIYVSSIAKFAHAIPWMNLNFQVPKIQDQQLIKVYVDAKLPQLKKLDTYHKAVALRNFVYANTTIGAPGSLAAPMTYQKFLQLISGKTPLLCGGISINYIALLNVYKIPAHIVYLTSNDTYAKTTQGDTHATVEIYANGKWILQDPTFNIHWESDGKRLSTIELARAFKTGETPAPNSDGYPLISNRRVEDYYIPYQKLLHHIEIGQYSQWGPEPCEGRLRIETVSPKERIPLDTKPLDGTPIFTYDFTAGMPTTWKIAYPDTTLVVPKKSSSQLSLYPKFWVASLHPSGTTITARCHPFGHLMNTNKPIKMAPGHYQMVVYGNINKGGISAGVKDIKSNLWVNKVSYPYDKIRKGTPIVIPFVIEKPGLYNLVLSNYSPTLRNISNWTISKVVVLQLPSN